MDGSQSSYPFAGAAFRLPAVVARVKAQYTERPDMVRALWRAVAHDCALLRELIQPYQAEAIDLALGTGTKFGDAGQEVRAPFGRPQGATPSPIPTAEVGQGDHAPSGDHGAPAPSAVPAAAPTAADISAAASVLRSVQVARPAAPPPQVFTPLPASLVGAANRVGEEIAVGNILKIFLVQKTPIGQLKPPAVRAWAAHSRRDARFGEMLCTGVPDTMTIGEAWTPAEAMAAYVRAGKETADV